MQVVSCDVGRLSFLGSLSFVNCHKNGFYPIVKYNEPREMAHKLHGLSSHFLKGKT